MRNKDEKKCKKGQETTIGKIIYGFLLFMPLFAIGATCLISTFNMSTKQQTKINYEYKTNEVNTIDDLIVGNIYTLNIPNWENVIPTGQVTDLVICSAYEFMNLDYSEMSMNQIGNNKYGITFNRTNNTLYLSQYEGNTWKTSINLQLGNLQTDFIVNFVYKESFDSNYISYVSQCQKITIQSVEDYNLNPQNVFYDSVDKVTESPLFSWATNSIIYTTTTSTCTALSITTPFIPLILSYWLIISVIYFLYDIALMLVWLIHRKIHELQESL